MGGNGEVRTQRRPADHGLFGPDSVTWRVWSHATAPTIGFQRAVVIEELDPFLVASVDATGRVRDRAHARYDNTVRYFATVAFGDSASAVRASASLMRLHARNLGTEPISGLRYDPNDPDAQLWILLTAWHSVLYAYEVYGPGRLSEADERRYWEECAIAAELQTCDPAKLPRTREGIRRYFEEVRPRLAASEATQAMMAHLLDASVIFPRLPAPLRPLARAFAAVNRAAVVATIPRWQRRLGGIRQPRIVDLLVVVPTRIAIHLAEASTRLKLAALAVLSPRTVPIAGPALRCERPLREETVAPAEAFAREGIPTPAELYERQEEKGTGLMAARPPVTA